MKLRARRGSLAFALQLLVTANPATSAPDKLDLSQHQASPIVAAYKARGLTALSLRPRALAGAAAAATLPECAAAAALGNYVNRNGAGLVSPSGSLASSAQQLRLVRRQRVVLTKREVADEGDSLNILHHADSEGSSIYGDHVHAVSKIPEAPRSVVDVSSLQHLSTQPYPAHRAPALPAAAPRRRSLRARDNKPKKHQPPPPPPPSERKEQEQNKNVKQRGRPKGTQKLTPAELQERRRQGRAAYHDGLRHDIRHGSANHRAVAQDILQRSRRFVNIITQHTAAKRAHAAFAAGTRERAMFEQLVRGKREYHDATAALMRITDAENAAELAATGTQQSGSVDNGQSRSSSSSSSNNVKTNNANDHGNNGNGGYATGRSEQPSSLKPPRRRRRKDQDAWRPTDEEVLLDRGDVAAAKAALQRKRRRGGVALRLLYVAGREAARRLRALPAEHPDGGAEPHAEWRELERLWPLLERHWDALGDGDGALEEVVGADHGLPRPMARVRNGRSGADTEDGVGGAEDDGVLDAMGAGEGNIAATADRRAMNVASDGSPLLPIPPPAWRLPRLDKDARSGVRDTVGRAAMALEEGKDRLKARVSGGLSHLLPTIARELRRAATSGPRARPRPVFSPIRWN